MADHIAEHADFFSFGTNDLTQTALGFSRDDIEGRILARYIDLKILDRSPFETIDEPGVGQLVRMGAWLGRKAKPDLKLGVCGEHGGDPDSIAFFHASGIDYVSCSPYRVPVARVAAAQAAVAGAARRLAARSCRPAARRAGAAIVSGDRARRQRLAQRPPVAGAAACPRGRTEAGRGRQSGRRRGRERRGRPGAARGARGRRRVARSRHARTASRARSARTSAIVPVAAHAHGASAGTSPADASTTSSSAVLGAAAR